MKRTTLVGLLLAVCGGCRDASAPNAGLPAHFDLVSIDGRPLPAAVGPSPNACTEYVIQHEAIAVGQPTGGQIAGTEFVPCYANSSRTYAYHLELTRSGSRLVLRYSDVDTGQFHGLAPTLWSDTGALSDTTLLLRAHYAPPDTGVNLKLYRTVR